MKKLIITFFLILTVFVVSCNNNKYTNLDSFSKCLNENNVKFYGAWWCPHCQDDKKLFGSSIENINYIECQTPDRQDTPVCLAANITAYPTWVFKDGTKNEGYMSLEQLAAKTGCNLAVAGK
jgi:thioredoxin-related protein